MEQSTSTVPRRQLGRYLQQLRDQGNLSIRTVSEALDYSRQKLWRIEHGIVPARPADVQMLCGFYVAPAELTELLVDLSRQTRVKGWWQAYEDVMLDWFEPYVVMEAEATRIRLYDTELVHGLLQTPAYMAEVIRVGRPDWNDEQRERRVALRRQRQRLLGRRGPASPRLEFVLSEAVLRRPIADHTEMAAQLRHLVAVGRLPTVSLRVLPLWAGPHAASTCGTFAMLDFAQLRRRAGDPSIVYQEGPTGALYLDRPGELARYEAIWSGIAAVALEEGESERMIASFAGEAR